jgi:hypothetical protein
VCTNHAWGSAFRSYGSPQSFLASESLVDELAEKMGMDPLELRYKNVYREGDTTPTGQKPEVYSFPEMFDKLRPIYQAALKKAKAESTPEKKKGVGLSLGIYGCGLDGPDASEISVELTPNGVVLASSWEDHGQGADIGALGTCHEALRPLKLAPDRDPAGHERHGLDAQQRSVRRQPPAGNDRKRHQERLRDAAQRHAQERRHLSHLRRDEGGKHSAEVLRQVDGLHVHPLR